MAFFFAFLAAVANAVASVQQRRTGQQEPNEREMSLRLVSDLLRNPLWLSGIAAVIAGFLLQATALSMGELASVQPVLAMELPITVALSRRVFGHAIDNRAWLATIGMTAGLAGLILFLAPSGGRPDQVAGWIWLVALLASFAVLATVVAWGRHINHDMARAGVYGAATGAGFGITAALMKGMTGELHNGISGALTTWQVYLMIATGILSMYLLQNAVAAGRLVAAQPGFTLADPVVAIVWGAAVFGEKVHTGWFLVAAAASFGVIVASVLVLCSSPAVREVVNDRPA